MPNLTAMRSTPSMAFVDTQQHHRHSVVEEGHLEEMVHDLLAYEDVPCDNDCHCEDQMKAMEDMLLTASPTLLYDGADYSILCATLALLTLQVKFGWSNTSVANSLFEYLSNSNSSVCNKLYNSLVNSCLLNSKMLPKGHKMPKN